MDKEMIHNILNNLSIDSKGNRSRKRLQKLVNCMGIDKSDLNEKTRNKVISLEKVMKHMRLSDLDEWFHKHSNKHKKKRIVDSTDSISISDESDHSDNSVELLHNSTNSKEIESSINISDEDVEVVVNKCHHKWHLSKKFPGLVYCKLCKDVQKELVNVSNDGRCKSTNSVSGNEESINLDDSEEEKRGKRKRQYTNSCIENEESINLDDSEDEKSDLDNSNAVIIDSDNLDVSSTLTTSKLKKATTKTESSTSEKNIKELTNDNKNLNESVIDFRPFSENTSTQVLEQSKPKTSRKRKNCDDISGFESISPIDESILDFKPSSENTSTQILEQSKRKGKKRKNDDDETIKNSGKSPITKIRLKVTCYLDNEIERSDRISSYLDSIDSVINQSESETKTDSLEKLKNCDNFAKKNIDNLEIFKKNIDDLKIYKKDDKKKCDNLEQPNKLEKLKKNFEKSLKNPKKISDHLINSKKKTDSLEKKSTKKSKQFNSDDIDLNFLFDNILAPTKKNKKKKVKDQTKILDEKSTQGLVFDEEFQTPLTPIAKKNKNDFILEEIMEDGSNIDCKVEVGPNVVNYGINDESNDNKLELKDLLVNESEILIKEAAAKNNSDEWCDADSNNSEDSNYYSKDVKTNIVENDQQESTSVNSDDLELTSNQPVLDKKIKSNTEVFITNSAVRVGVPIEITLPSFAKAIKILESKPKLKSKSKYAYLCRPGCHAVKNTWDRKDITHQYIKKCIKEQKWGLLKELIKILIKSGPKHPYDVKELSFLDSIVHANDNPKLLQDFVNEFFVNVPPSHKTGFFDVWMKAD